jgi:hypothetical protein
MRHQQATPLDERVAERALKQDGVVSVVQLRALGMTAAALRRRRGAGWLHEWHRGVYAVSASPTARSSTTRIT